MTVDFELAADAVKPRLRETIAMVVFASVAIGVYLVTRPAVVACCWVADKARERQP